METILNFGGAKTQFTPEQRAAITHRGTSLLVSAAAGSGKTRVLVERLLNRIDEGSNIDEFLIITYTRAAAHELKERINDGLYDRQRQNKKKTHYRRQVMLCNTASIDTIHTFCGEILRENAHLAGLPPDFRVIDENESEIIKREVISDVLDFAYEEKIEGFSDLLSMVIEGRDDKNLEEIVLDIDRKLQSLPNPQQWMEAQKKNLSEVGTLKLTETDCGKYITNELKELVSYCANQLNALREEVSLNSEFKAKYGASIETSYSDVKKLEGSLNLSWDEACENRNIEFPRTGSLSGYNDLKAIRTWCRDELRKGTKILENSSHEHMEDLKQIAPALIALMNLIEKFAEAYALEKRKRGVADFSDMEHLTLSLLIDKNSGEKTQIAKSLAKRFTEIMVDEYQDVNEVQEMIFKAISKEESNIFMVGDVKQSIYRFRLADPGIFLSKYAGFKEAEIEEIEEKETSRKTENKAKSSAKSVVFDSNESKNVGVKIHLSKNFRSHSGILDTVNHIFTRIMSPKLGEMQYSQHERLVPGRDPISDSVEKKGIHGKQGKKKNAESVSSLEGRVSDILIDPLIMQTQREKHTIPVEFDFISTKSREEETADESTTEDIKAVDLEAKHIVNRIVELFETGYSVPEKDGTMRALRYSDIVILSRSQKGVASRYAAALSSAGIPTDISTGEDFFASREILGVLSLLSVIDNPTLDIELAATLSGPIYNFSSDELAIIKTDKNANSYYDAVICAAEHDTGTGELSSKCRSFIEDIETYRTLAADMTADRLLWYIYNKTELFAAISAMSSAEMRKENLTKLTELAVTLEKSGYKGLFGFLSYIRKLKARDSGQFAVKSLGAATSVNRDAVSIMTIHKSKGLEFPVVFLTNTSKRHNNLDSQKPIIFHKELGVGSMLINRQKRIKYTTLQKAAIASKLKAEMLSEELRVLYVAMTRACEKLIVTATYTDAESKVDKIQQTIIGMPSPQELSRMSSLSDWIVAGLKDIDSDKAQINFITPEDIAEQKPVRVVQNAESENKEKIGLESKSFEFTYPYESSISIPSKVTVTGIKKLADKDAEAAPWAKIQLKERATFVVPTFIEKRGKRNAAELGTLLHHVMQHIDYKICSSDHDADKALQSLAESGVIEESDTHEIDSGRIVSFFSSDLGKRLAAAEKVNREFTFSILIPAEGLIHEAEKGGKHRAKLYSKGCKCGAKEVEKCSCDKVLLQGVIDCFFEEDGELVLVDFKTDKVTKNTIEKKASDYAPQLNTYAEALERITKKRVKERVIYFFEAGEAHSL
ncbi:MAG: UvrD-helicase domain-containing protein [Oscillospiraceae bacterium]|nr:UvrD-helicase domain-containing protein [Oscillospiraceae bacterium]MCL2278594.1 UvrD-helicase domain-containing protein [Oscillospiraceae bacterium]